ncbi:MAG: hypothetical protein K5978_07540, partial [Campylobacter sp.]|nr:hypothetical protein [Campylobacter sp.]
MRFFVLIFCFACLLFGQNIQRVMSNIPPAKEHYINLESEICSSTCLRVLLKNDMLISFLTQFDKAYADDDLAVIYSNLLGGVSYASEQNVIAVIIPKRVIKSYSKIVQNALTGYVLEKNLKLSLKFINSGDENPASLQNAMNSARKMGARVFIAPLTLNGAKSLNSLIYANEIAYIPTVNISSMPEAKANLIFGGVDYEAQLNKLIKLSGEKITAFSDGSGLGEWLNAKVLQLSSGMIYTEKLRGKDIKLENQISKPHKINKSYVFLNLPLIKATLIATQLKGLEV